MFIDYKEYCGNKASHKTVIATLNDIDSKFH